MNFSMRLFSLHSFPNFLYYYVILFLYNWKNQYIQLIITETKPNTDQATPLHFLTWFKVQRCVWIL